MSEALASSPAAEDTSAPGLATDAPAATETEEQATNSLDYIEAEDENEAAVKARKRDEGEGAEGDADAPKSGDAPAADSGLVEIEAADGSKVKVPAALKDDFLRHADYTRKTQEVAEKARALEVEHQTWQAQQEESRLALPEEYAKVSLLARDIAAADRDLDTPLDARGTTLRGIDWVAWRNGLIGLQDDDPNVLKFKQYRAAFDNANLSVEDGKRALAAAKEDLSTKEQTRLTEQQQAQETARAAARQQTGEALKAEGWTAERMAKVANVAATEFGYSPEELLNATDPRAWKMADKVISLQAENAKLTDQLKKTTAAASNLKDQASRPAEPAKGNAQPTRARDDNSTETWMERRNRDVAAKQAKARAGAR